MKRKSIHKIAGMMHGLRNPVLTLMRKKKISKEDYDAQPGISYQSMINTWNTGKVSSPQPDKVRTIAALLKIDPLILMRDIQCWMNEDWQSNPVKYVKETANKLE